MAVPEYIAGLRKHVGTGLLWLPSVSAVVVNDAGEVLLAKRSDTGNWSVVSGFADPGEQPAAAVVREVREETGVEVVPERISSVRAHPMTYPNGDRCQFMNVAFRCRPVGGTARVNDDESVAVGWFRPDALPDVDEHGGACLAHGLKATAEAWFEQPGGVRPPATPR
jgi:ADP-ribose pyrophosphatase YjhB (NUDIX family)